MSAIARIDVNRLAAVLGMMGSDHDGEALTAARTAERLRRQAGLAWHDLLAREGPAQVPPERRPDPADDWRELVAACMAYTAALTIWERDFVATLAEYRHRPSARQMDVLRRLTAKAAAS